MELITSAFKIALDERYKDINRKDLKVEGIIEEFIISALTKKTLLEIYNIFAVIIVEHWQKFGEEIATRIFDLLFKEWDVTPKIVAPLKMSNEYHYNPEEDF
jgi:hypothetical protein